MSKIVGIDLGTTNSLVATVDSGIPLVIADAEGRRLTPSVVHFPAPDAEPMVGHTANRVRVVKPAETVYSVKRFIGRRASEVSEEEMLVTFPVKSETAGQVRIPVHGRDYLPEEISAEVLKKLKQDAETYFGEAVTRAVITVPAYFNDAQRNATKKAGELAGLTVERIINEPTAAALAYGLDKLKEKSKIAVYDLGGGTFDLSILELHEGVFQVLATNGNTRLGGDDLDRRVVDFLVAEIQERAAGILPAELASAMKSKHCQQDAGSTLPILSRIREAAEQAKIKLSTETEVEIALPFLTPNFSFNWRLTRAELEALTRDLIARTRTHCLRALADAKLEPKDLDQVILVGGQTRMPLVRQLVAEWFGCAEFEETRGSVRLGTEYHRPAGPQLNTSQNPDEVVALGSAIQAEILSGGFRQVLLLDVTPLSLGIETFGGLMNVIIPRNSTIPVKAGEMFTTAVDQQRSMLIHVLQGERERAKDNWSLGKFDLEFAAAPRGVPRVGVQFEIDANGILHVLARDTKTGREKAVEMKSAVDVDDAAVQQMVEESIEHAFEDLAARRWVEAKLKANELSSATRKALADAADELEAGCREQIERALQILEAVLANEQPETNYLGSAPTANPGAAQTCRNQWVGIMLSGSDPDGDPLAYTVVTGPTLGTLSPPSGSPGQYRIYTPNPGQCGQDSFQFKVSDGLQDSTPATVTVDVGNPNPIADCRDVICPKGQSVTFQLSGSDPLCNEPLRFAIGDPPSEGGAVQVISQDPPDHATVTFTPRDSSFGERDFFNFTVSSCGFVSPQPGQVTVYVVSPPLLITSCREDRIVLHWSIPEWIASLQVIDGFRIYRCDTTPPGQCTPSGTPIATITDPDARSYEDTDPGLQQGRTYCYRVNFFMADSCDPLVDRESPFSNTSCSQLCSPPALLVVGNNASTVSGPGPIQTYEFATGSRLASFLPEHAGNGRGLAVRGTEMFYTERFDYSIHVCPWPGDVTDIRTLQNTWRPNVEIQDLAFHGDGLYILTGYPNQELQIFKLNPSTGAVLGGPITIAGPASSDSDGFTVLPNGNFLINDFDGAIGPCPYREYNGTTGELIPPPGGLEIDLTEFGFSIGTGVAVAPDGQSLCFVAHNLYFTFSTLVQTDLAGNLLGFQGIGYTQFEDIDAVAP